MLPSAYILAALTISSRSEDHANPTLTVCILCVLNECKTVNAMGDLSGPIAVATDAGGQYNLPHLSNGEIFITPISSSNALLTHLAFPSPPTVSGVPAAQ